MEAPRGRGGPPLPPHPSEHPCAAAVGGVGCVDAARDPRAGCEGGACNTPHGSRRLGSYQTAPSWPQAVAVSGAPRGQLDYHVLSIDKDSELAHLSAEIRHVLGDHGPGTGRQLPCRAQPVDLGVSEQWCAGPAVEPSPLPRSPHGDAINRTWPDLSWRARFAMCSATTARGKVGSLRSQDIPWIDAGSARGVLCGCCNPAPGRAALLRCHFSAALQHRFSKLKIWSAARCSSRNCWFHHNLRGHAVHMGSIERYKHPGRLLAGSHYHTSSYHL